MSSLNSKRMLLMGMALFGLVAAIVCGIVLALGVVEPSRERIFLVGSIVIVSVVCLFLSMRFKGDAIELEAEMKEAEYVRLQKEAKDPDDIALPQNAPAAPDMDDMPLPQNRPQSGGGAS